MRIRNNRLARRAAAVGTAVAMAGGLGLATATPATAAGKNGTCESGELCLFYLTNSRAPVFDLFIQDGDFRNDAFPTRPGIRADNNTESVRNRDTFTWYVYTGYYRGGARGTVSPGTVGNFTTTFKNTVSSAYYYL